MTLWQRRALYSTAFGIFFLVTPLLIFYAAGYRYDIHNRRVTTVGAFYIKSYPAGSQISIDGKRTTKRTPNRILNVLPGTHTVTVSRDGFIPWEKKLEIRASETTFVRDIVLFRSDQPSLSLSTGGIGVISNADETVYAYLDADGIIHLTSLISESDYRIETVTPVDELLSLSQNGDRLLIAANGQWSIIDVNTEKAVPVAALTTNLDEPQFDPILRDRLWALDGTTLMTLDLRNGNKAVGFSGITDYDIQSNRILTLRRSQSDYTLTAYPGIDAEPLWTQSFTASEQLDIRPSTPDGVVTLASDRSLWVIDPSRNTSQRFDATMHDWHGSTLLYGTPYEVSLYSAETQESRLVDRSSDTFSRLLWHPSGSYFVWQRGATLSIVETDDRDIRNTVPLLLTSHPEQFFLFNKKGSRLFVLEPTNNQIITLQ